MYERHKFDRFAACSRRSRVPTCGFEYLARDDLQVRGGEEVADSFAERKVFSAVHVQQRPPSHHLLVPEAGASGPALREVVLVIHDVARDERVADGDADTRDANHTAESPHQLDEQEHDWMRRQVNRHFMAACVPVRPSLCPGDAARYRSGVRSSTDRVFLVIAALVFADTFGYAIVLPLLPFAAEREGAPAFVIGAVFATYSLCQLVAAPLLGSLSDRIGRRPVLVLSQTGSAAGFLILASTGTLLPMFISRVVDGLTAGNISTAYAVILDRFRREDWAARFAMLGSATGAGIVAGLLTSSLLASGGVRAGAWVAFALAALTALGTYLLLPETRVAQGRAKEQMRLRTALASGGPYGLRRTVVAALVSMVLQAAFLVTLPLYLMRTLGYAEQQTTIFLTALVGGAAVFQLGILPRLMRALGERRAALLGFVAASAGGLVCAGASELAAVAFGAALTMGAVVILNPAFTSLIGGRHEAAGEGTLMGINQSTASLGQLIGPVVGYAALGLGSAAAFGAGLLVLGVIGVLVTLTIAT